MLRAALSRFSNPGQGWDRKLFDLPRVSAVHEMPRTGLFQSYVVRSLWRFWTLRLSVGGRYFFLATALFFGYGATSLELQAFVPLAYSVAVWGIALLVYPFERPRVKLAASHPERIGVGADLTIEIEVTAEGVYSPAGTVLPHRVPQHIAVFPAEGASLPALPRGKSARAQFRLRPSQRGVYRLRGYRVETDFPFGLINCSREFDEEDQLTVYPCFDPLDRLDLPMGRRYQPGGVAFTAPRGESMEYVGNRDYREGDSIRDIDWRATARLSRPIVREFREEYFLRCAVVLDTQVAGNSALELADFERAVSLCAACGDFMNRADYLVDILAAGTHLHHLLAGRGTGSLDQMLDILAGVERSSQPPWPQLEPVLFANLEQIASVVCLFLDWDEPRRAFAASLASTGSAVKVVIVRSCPPTLDPLDSWPGEVARLGEEEFKTGIRQF